MVKKRVVVNPLIKENKTSFLIILIILLIVALLFVAFVINKEKQAMVQEPTVISDVGRAIQEPEISVEQTFEIQEPPKPTIVYVDMKGFNPIKLTISAGTTITFTSVDSRRHVINHDLFKLTYGTGLNVENDRALDKEGDTFSYTFNDAGVYKIIDAVFGKYVEITVEKPVTPLITGQVISPIVSQNSFVPVIFLVIFLAIGIGIVLGKIESLE